MFASLLLLAISELPLWPYPSKGATEEYSLAAIRVNTEDLKRNVFTVVTNWRESGFFVGPGFRLYLERG
jgi:hypothetical protein